jgi:hypothetical protein
LCLSRVQWGQAQKTPRTWICSTYCKKYKLVSWTKMMGLILSHIKCSLIHISTWMKHVGFKDTDHPSAFTDHTPLRKLKYGLHFLLSLFHKTRLLILFTYADTFIWQCYRKYDEFNGRQIHYYNASSVYGSLWLNSTLPSVTHTWSEQKISDYIFSHGK